MDILDLVCAKLHEEAGIYKVLIGRVTLLFLFHLFYIYFFLYSFSVFLLLLCLKQPCCILFRTHLRVRIGSLI